jgi:hypothetical protein
MQQKISTANISQQKNQPTTAKEAMVQNRKQSPQNKVFEGSYPDMRGHYWFHNPETPGSGPIPTNNRETH